MTREERLVNPIDFFRKTANMVKNLVSLKKEGSKEVPFIKRNKRLQKNIDKYFSSPDRLKNNVSETEEEDMKDEKIHIIKKVSREMALISKVVDEGYEKTIESSSETDKTFLRTLENFEESNLKNLYYKTSQKIFLH